MHAKLSIVCFLVGSIVLSTAPAQAAKPPVPEGRTYFVVIMGLGDTPYEQEADCFTFDADEVCATDVCLTWRRVEAPGQTRKQTAFEMEGEIDDDGLLIDVEGQGRAENRGQRSTIAVAARAAALGQKLNFGITGREVGASGCQSLLEDFAQAAAGD